MPLKSIYFCLCHGICKIGRGFLHEIFEEVARLEAYDQSQKLSLIGSLGNRDGLTIEACYVMAQAFLKALFDETGKKSSILSTGWI